MSILENLILNPVEFSPELAEIDLSGSGIRIGPNGPDYGEASQTIERVKLAIGEGVTGRQWPSIDCTIPLWVGTDQVINKATAYQPIEAFVGELQRGKMLWIRRDFADLNGFSGSVACPVDAGALTSPVGLKPNEIVLRLSRSPIWYATTEVLAGEVKGTAVRDLQLELADLLGTAPGLITVRLKNEGVEDWRGCYVSLECQDFDPAATAEPKYEAAQLTPKGGAYVSALNPPVVRAVGTVAAGTGAISPGLPAGTATGDLLIMVAESGGATTAGEANTALTAAGWKAALTGSEKKGNTRLTLLYRIAEAVNPTLTNDTGDHQMARIIGIKAGTFDPAAPFNLGTVGTQAATKAVSIPGNAGVGTTRDNCLVIACASGNLPDSTGIIEFSAPVNASLTGLIGQIDNSTAEGDGGAVFAVTGVLAARGTYAATTATAQTEAERACMSLAVNPFPEIVKCPPLTAGWQTVLGSEVAGVGHMTHVDPRRMIFRIDDVSTVLGDVKWKLEWRTLGAATWSQTMVASTPVVLSSPVIGNYQLLDLGEARPERPVTGEPLFQWRLQARSINNSRKQPLIRDVYPMSMEQWARVSDSSESMIDGEPSSPPSTLEQSEILASHATWTVTGAEKASLTAKAGEESNPLVARNFNLPVPAGATIRGVIPSFAGSDRMEDTVVKLVKGGVASGENKARHIADPFEEVRSYGGPTDLWGLALAVSDVTAANFGVEIRVKNIAGGVLGGVVKRVTLTVAYTEGENENRICFATRSMELTDTGARRQHATEEAWGDVPAPEGVLLTAPAPGQAAQGARLLAIPTVGDLATRPDSASVKAALKYSYRPGYLFCTEAGA